MTPSLCFETLVVGQHAAFLTGVKALPHPVPASSQVSPFLTPFLAPSVLSHRLHALSSPRNTLPASLCQIISFSCCRIPCSYHWAFPLG